MPVGLSITEFSGARRRYETQCAVAPALSTQVLTVGTVESATLGHATYLVRLCSDASCSVAFGRAATTADTYLPAGVPEYFLVTPGTVVSVISNS